MRKRLDLKMVELGLAPSRTRAQDLIKSGSVIVNGKTIRSSSYFIDSISQIQIQQSELFRYVSRGGLKMEGALKEIRKSVRGLHVLDVGLSTGGFTDCLLQAGAEKVVGVDVGHDQLHPHLRNDQRLTSIEGVNARELDLNPQVMNSKPPAGWPFAVVDVSFISLTLVLPSLTKVVAAQGEVLALVKPQFEVGPEGLAKGGIVKDEGQYVKIEAKIRRFCQDLNLNVKKYFASPIEGKDGNREFFVWIQKLN